MANDIRTVKKLFRKAWTMPMYPDKKKFPHYQPDHVFEEDETVRWNKEEVARRNKLRDDEVDRLNKEASKALAEANEAIIDYIKNHTQLNDRGANLLWNYIYERYHYSVDELFSELPYLIQLVNKLQFAR